jgi:hypothetical protein
MPDPSSRYRRAARLLRVVARGTLILVCLFWFVFALLSGAEELGGGLGGILRNSPNALPWVVLALLIALAFRFERAGGAMIVLAGGLAALQFNAVQAWQAMVLIPLPVVLCGVALFVTGTLDPRR